MSSEEGATEKGTALVQVFKPEETAVSRRLMDVIEAVVQQGEIEVHSTLQNLEHRLRAPSRRTRVLVLFASNRDALVSLLNGSDRLIGEFIILIVPDSQKETVSLGHRLRPRLLTYADSDFSEISAVLNHLAYRSENGTTNREITDTHEGECVHGD